ncbi:Uncharacterized protein TCM_011123 [Theobroma cacao]|uniref:RNase H type-1 domain-containing protein n=1 Tax=Theobroma cacao TaxID=3641 RepID=A0A061EA09_THECC|nr:Uncharacterized protein TCM_011123 [Theobroma cacao]
MCNALQTFVASKWVVSHKVIVDNDFENFMKWIKDPCSVPWKLMPPIMLKVDFLKSQIKEINFNKIPRSANEIVNFLMKSGI